MYTKNNFKNLSRNIISYYRINLHSKDGMVVFNADDDIVAAIVIGAVGSVVEFI